MPSNASFIPPNITPPEPPEAKVVALIFSAFMSFLLLLLIGIVSIDFLAEMIGHPFHAATKEPPQDSLLPPEQWTRSSVHPGTDKVDQCGDCHELHDLPAVLWTENSGSAIGAWKGMTSCFACHKEEEHAVIHQRVQPTANRCLRCHAMH